MGDIQYRANAGILNYAGLHADQYRVNPLNHVSGVLQSTPTRKSSAKWQCKKLGKIFTGPTDKLLFRFMVIWYLYRSFISNKPAFTKFCLTQWISKPPGSFENPLSKTVPGKIHGSGGHTKCNCLQDWVNFHRSRAWQIVLIFNTWITY